jgi:hypothetical protein
MTLNKYKTPPLTSQHLPQQLKHIQHFERQLFCTKSRAWETSETGCDRVTFAAFWTSFGLFGLFWGCASPQYTITRQNVCLGLYEVSFPDDPATSRYTFRRRKCSLGVSPCSCGCGKTPGYISLCGRYTEKLLCRAGYRLHYQL